jgi:hypothetical protein
VEFRILGLLEIVVAGTVRTLPAGGETGGPGAAAQHRPGVPVRPVIASLPMDRDGQG